MSEDQIPFDPESAAADDQPQEDALEPQHSDTSPPDSAEPGTRSRTAEASGLKEAPERAGPPKTAKAPAQAASRARRRTGRNDQIAEDASEPADPGADLERRVGRTEFNDGALVRLRVPIRVDADSGRQVLTDIDVLAIDVDGRLRISRSILECKSGSGQAGEPDRLLWLAGLQRFLRFERAVLVRRTVSRRGRGLARALDLRTLDVTTLAAREAAHAWVPTRFGHIDGPECLAAEKRADTQLKGLGHIPADLVAYLRHDALRSEPHRILSAVASLGRAVEAGGVLPDPTRGVLAGHALIAMTAAALSDANRLDEMSPDDLWERTNRALVTGNPNDEQILSILGRADRLVDYSLERVHGAYQEAGAKRVAVDFPSLKESVTTPPGWLARYVDLAQKLRANPSVARQMLQTIDLAVFEALPGGRAHEAAAFDHLFTEEHRYLLNVACRCLKEIAGAPVADALTSALALDFSRGARMRGNRDVPPE